MRTMSIAMSSSPTPNNPRQPKGGEPLFLSPWHLATRAALSTQRHRGKEEEIYRVSKGPHPTKPYHMGTIQPGSTHRTAQRGQIVLPQSRRVQ